MISTEVIHSLSGQFGLVPFEESAFKDRLTAAINDFIVNDFPGLVQILYRLDISESKVKEMLVSNPRINASVIIAELLIERETQKIKTRGDFKSDENIPDDEKW